MMTSSQKPKFSVNFRDFPRNFKKFSSKFAISGQNFQVNSKLKFLWLHMKGWELYLDSGVMLLNFLRLFYKFNYELRSFSEVWLGTLIWGGGGG